MERSEKARIAYPGRMIAIFVNGCFWRYLPLPIHDLDIWKDKFEKNVERDKRKHGELESIGWNVIVVWECEIEKEPQHVLDTIIDALKRTDRTSADPL